MCIGSSVAAISAAISAAFSAAIVYFRGRGNKLIHRNLAINWQLGNFGHKQSQGLLKLNLVSRMVSNLYLLIFDPVRSLNITLNVLPLTQFYTFQI